MCRHGVISTSQGDSLLLIRVNSCMSISSRWESTLLPSVVISVHAVVWECWPYFSVAGDQQGCDFNSVDFDRIKITSLLVASYRKVQPTFQLLLVKNKASFV